MEGRMMVMLLARWREEGFYGRRGRRGRDIARRSSEGSAHDSA